MEFLRGEQCDRQKKRRICAPVTRYLRSCVAVAPRCSPTSLQRCRGARLSPGPPAASPQIQSRTIDCSAVGRRAGPGATTRTLIRQKSISHVRSTVTSTTARRSIRSGKQTIGPRENTPCAGQLVSCPAAVDAHFYKEDEKMIRIPIGEN